MAGMCFAIRQRMYPAAQTYTERVGGSKCLELWGEEHGRIRTLFLQNVLILYAW
jgi:hypothetical protein